VNDLTGTTKTDINVIDECRLFFNFMDAIPGEKIGKKEHQF